jgi:signal transduction histidine kinase
VVVEIDAALVRRALENLLANALRYTRARTTVTLAIEVGPASVDLTVADRGPGVPDAAKDRVFEKYGSVETGAAPTRRGRGLGLYLVKLASEAHGGAVSVEDREGGGAIFRIRIPRAVA